MDSDRHHDKFPVAIVGIGCRMPGGVTDPREFWDVLVEGRDMITEVPPDRWSIESFHDPDQSNHSKMVTKKCGFIHDIDMFDNAFFKISPREAASMDPQQRHVLEVTYEAFQDAGIIPDTLVESCGVFMGVGMMDYPIMQSETTLINPYTHTGSAHSSIANRISYVFNLRGPSMTVDTACAASVTAMHLACRALWDGECSTAVAGGCNNLLIPEVTVGFSALGVLSPEGKSCPFSDTAKGYVRSEGCASLILRPLNDALKNNDHIYAVIQGSAVAANGSSKSITMPSAEAQEMVIRNVYKRFNIPISSVGYVEAHGTGTPVGDPIEAEAIGVTFGPERQTPIKIGSVKSNFGHNECAAGVTAAIKVSLMLQNKRLVPTINFNEVNLAIDVKKLNLQIQTETEDIDSESKPYTIGLNSFGFVGAIAHMVFKEAPAPVSRSVPTSGWSFGSETTVTGNSILIPLSAKTEEALRKLATKWTSFACPKDALSVSSWQATRRDHHQYRLAVIADSAESFRNILNSYIQDEGSVSLIAGTANQNKPKICFVFPGQGQQWVDMGRNLYTEEPVFHDAILECDSVFKKLSGWSILETCGLFNGHGNASISAQEALKQIHIIQPAIFFVQVGVYRLWRHWGVEPHVVVGHSLGETAAAYACGGLTLQKAIAVVFYRSKEQAKLKDTGRMAALRANIKQANEICKQRQGVYISAVNGPGDVTLGGDTDAIAAIVTENPGKAKQLRVTCPFHTPVMDSIKESFEKSMRDSITSEPGKRNIPFYSTVTGHYHQEALNTEYWWSNIRKPVLFQNAVEEILQDTDIDIFLEISAAATLLASVKHIVRSRDPQRGISTIYSCLRDKNDRHSIQRALGSLYVAGVDINWNHVTQNAAQWAPIPTYPWQHKRFWVETEDRKKRRLGLDDRSFKGQDGKISLTNFPFLADHQVDNRIVFPGAGYVEYLAQMNFEAKEQPKMTDISFMKVLTWPEDSNDKRVTLNLKMITNGDHIRVECENNMHCTAIIGNSDREYRPSSILIKNILERCNKEVTKNEFYTTMHHAGLQYGPAFQVVEKAFMGDEESLAYLTSITDTNQRISIPHLDATFQLALASASPCVSTYLPIHIDSLHLTTPSLPSAEALVVYTHIVDYDSHYLTANITIARESGVILAEVKGFKAQSIRGNQTGVDIDACIYTTQWQPISAHTPLPTIIECAFNESHLNATYSDEMDAIRRANEVMDDIEGICTSYIRYALQTVPEEKRFKGQTYKKYITRFNTIASSTTVKDIPHDTIPEAIERIHTHCPEFDTEMGLIKSLGEVLPDTLCDPQIAVPIMFGPEGLNKYFYDSLSTRVHYKAVAETIANVVGESLKHKGVLRIVEIGGRLGGLTRFILEPLKELGLSHQLEYVFTDFNATFFKQAENNLAAFPFIQYKPLDIEREVSKQGFVSGSFDIVVCLDTLHAAIDVQRSTDFVSNLLLPNGLMFIIEATTNHFEKELCFAALDVCWLFDDFRKESCWLNRQGWVDVMRKIGLQEVTSASTPREFFHSVIVGRAVKSYISSNIDNTESVEPANLLIVREINNQFEDEMQSVYKGKIDIKSFSDAKLFQNVLNKHKASPTEVIYVYSEADNNLQALLKLLQAVEQCPQGVSRVWVISRGANKESSNPNASAAIGLTRAVSNHTQTVPIFSIDFEATCNIKENVQTMMDLLKESDLLQREIAIRNGVRYVPVTVHQQLQTGKTVSENWRVEQVVSATGHDVSIDDLAFHDVSSYDVPPGYVKISVRAAPLNFKDVMMCMGLLQGLDSDIFPSFGIECSGVVKELGEGVSSLNMLKVGDEVIALGKKCFGSHVICSAQLTTHKPQNLDWIESASIGVVFVTAYLSLVERGRLQPTETVLIHSACGGVGLAAIQIARMLGAKIICTAGSNKKREYLRDVLGIQLVSDSRSTQFYDDVMSFTEGRGVDVVLNSLSGKLLSTSMAVLAPCGRFCEIGKRDILQNSNMPMKIFLDNKHFISCQVDILMQHSPSTVNRLLQKVVNLFESKKLHPIPTAVYSMGNLIEAFRVMSKGSHIGKIVFDIDEFQPEEVKPALQQFPPTATYIVTGGFGGIGQALARWLCDNGVRHIVLVSRKGPRNVASRRMIDYLKCKGVKVHQFQIDVSDYHSVQSMLGDLRGNKKVPPIRGIFHLAGIIEEAGFADLTKEEMDRILGAKAGGANHLHTLTKEDDLEIFFLLSSVTTVWGNPAQPAYTAANNYLDALAEYRHSNGLPALSIQLGAVRGAGYLEDKEDIVNVLKMSGNLQIHIDEFLHVLGKLLQQKDLPVVCLANQDWHSTQRFCHNSMLKFHHLAAIKTTTDKTDVAMGKEDMEECIKSKMADILCMPVDAIDVNQPMINYGVDSLVAIEMVTWATNQLGITVTHLDILSGITTAALLQKAREG